MSILTNYTADDFSVNEEVRIITERPPNYYLSPNWVSDMNAQAGQIGRVIEKVVRK